MNLTFYHQLLEELQPAGVQLLAVSKTRRPEEIMELFARGQRDFGENYVQELVDKQSRLPADIRWHFIGHLQTNKVKYIAPFVYMIQGVDSRKLLLEIDKQAKKNRRTALCLLQVHIAKEETKFGFSEPELNDLLQALRGLRSTGQGTDVKIAGLMGMASLTGNPDQIRQEFRYLRSLFDKVKTMLPEDPVQTLSMGMSGDYRIAIQEGSTMIRIGTALFGERIYKKEQE
jgi:pyridoxal phosphate enzyme (YggS family)